jgi:hypothetical protein
VAPAYHADIMHGRPVPVAAAFGPYHAGQEVALYDETGCVLAVAEFDPAHNSLHPRIVLLDT